MRLDLVKNISLGLLVFILLLVSWSSFFSINTLSKQLKTVVEMHLPVREKLMLNKELMLNANIVFNEFKENDYSTGEEIIPILHKLQTSITPIAPDSPYDSTKIQIFSSLRRILVLLQPVLGEESNYARNDKNNTQQALLEELQKEFNTTRSFLHILFSNAEGYEEAASLTDQFSNISQLMNVFENQIRFYFEKNNTSADDIFQLIDLCQTNITVLYDNFHNLSFSLDNQELIKNFIAALRSYKSAIILFDDELKLGVSGSNLDEITSLANIYQKKAFNLLEELTRKTLEDIASTQQLAISSLAYMQYLFIITSVFAIFLAIALSVWFSSFLTKRFDRLVKGAEKIGHGQLDFRIYHSNLKNDHFDRLAMVFNNMASALQKRETLLTQNIDSIARTQKLAAIGSLASGIAHDFNNILVSIICLTEVVKADVPENETNIQNDLSVILSSSLRAKDLVIQLLSFSNQRAEVSMTPIELVPAIHDSIKMLRAISPSSIDISYQINDSCVVMGNQTQIYQVITNIEANATQAMETTGGKLEIRMNEIILSESDVIAYAHMCAGRYAMISISDTGPGIDSEIVERIFDPYFTTKEIGKGAGLGLFVAFGIIQKHGGTIKVNSELDKGSIFEILLPITETTAMNTKDDKHEESIN